jgi:hypothetical protein
MSSAFGPLSAEEFQQAVDAPFGQASKMLQKHDPLWGKTAGDLATLPPVKRWRVKLRQDVTMEGSFYVEARTEEEAFQLVMAEKDVESRMDRFVSSDTPYEHSAEAVE